MPLIDCGYSFPQPTALNHVCMVAGFAFASSIFNRYVTGTEVLLYHMWCGKRRDRKSLCKSLLWACSLGIALPKRGDGGGWRATGVAPKAPYHFTERFTKTNGPRRHFIRLIISCKTQNALLCCNPFLCRFIVSCNIILRRLNVLPLLFYNDVWFSLHLLAV